MDVVSTWEVCQNRFGEPSCGAISWQRGTWCGRVVSMVVSAVLQWLGLFLFTRAAERQTSLHESWYVVFYGFSRFAAISTYQVCRGW
jgi:hypothetical protein